MVHPWERGERVSRQYRSGSRECREAVGHCSPQDAPSGRERAPAVSKGLGEAEIQVSTAAAGSASQGRHSWGPRRGPRGSWQHSRACVAASCRQDSSCPCLQSVSSWPKAAALLGQGCRAAPRRKAPEEGERGRGRSPWLTCCPRCRGGMCWQRGASGGEEAAAADTPHFEAPARALGRGSLHTNSRC